MDTDTLPKVRVQKLIADSFKRAFKDILAAKDTDPKSRTYGQDLRQFFFDGGRGSTKSSFISMMIILLMTMNPNSNAVVLVRVADNIRQSVYNQIIWAISKLKLDKYFKCTTSPFLCEYRADPDDPNCPVQQIVFRGLDKAGKLKGIKPKQGVFDIIWFEELTEFAGMEDIRSVMQSVLRGGTDDDDGEEEEGQGEGEGEEEEVKTRAFFSYNPPPSMNNWVNEEASVEEPGRKCYHSNYLTVNPKWLRKGFIEEANNLRRRNPRAYAHEYLGLITGTGGNVFKNLEIRDITDEEITTKFNNRCFGIDWGFTTDPFVWLGMHFDTDRQWLYIFSEIYKHGLRTQQSCELVRRYMKEMASPRAVIYADAAEPDSIADFNNWGVRVEAAPKPHGATWSGRDYEIKALADLNKIIIDPHYCPNTAREFSHYEYQKNAQGKFMEVFEKANDHAIDACFPYETKVITPQGETCIGKLIGTQGKILSYDNGKFVWEDYRFCTMTRLEAETVIVETEDGQTLECTPDHRILTENRGWVEAKDLLPKDFVIASNVLYGKKIVRVKAVKPSGRKIPVYDMEVPRTHNFVADGIVVHNCRYGLFFQLRSVGLLRC